VQYTPSPEHLTRLSLTRCLLQQAEQQIALPAPRQCLALLSLHDAIEMFLDTAAEAVGVPLGKKTDFKDYWRSFASPNSPVQLPLERSMAKINAARVALKHHGQRPTSDQLVHYLVTATNFFDEVCPALFGVALHEISMSNIVKDEQTRNLLKTAETQLAEGKPSDALASVALAFALGSRDVWREQWVSPNFQDAYPDIAGEIEGILEEHNRAITLIHLGVNLNDYNRFSMLTPMVHCLFNEWKIFGKRMTEKVEDVRWCIDFVVEFMLRAEERKRPELL
jgi:hypothetical protein